MINKRFAAEVIGITLLLVIINAAIGGIIRPNDPVKSLEIEYNEMQKKGKLNEAKQ